MPTATPTSSPTPTATPVPPTNTPVPPTNTPTPVPPTSTPLPTSTATPVPPTSTPTPTHRETAASQLSKFIPWIENPPDTTHATAADVLTAMWIQDSELAETFARMPWVADGVTGGESAALEAVVSNASPDTEWARLTVSLPWFLDGVTSNERNAIIFLREIAQSNLELAKVATDLPWLADGVTNDELNTIKFLSRATSEHLELVQTITKRHWFTNSIDTHNESWAIQRLVRIAENDPELARTIAILPGLNDGITDDHLSAIYSLESIAENDLELANVITNLPWLTDDITRDEEIVLNYFDLILGTDVELARMVAGFPWFTDDITEEERGIIGAIRRTDADWASQLAASVNDLLTSMKDITGDLSTYTAESLGRIAEQGPDAFGQLTSQPWYADGLNDEEAALVVILGDIIDSSPLLYQDLLHSRFTQTKTVSLPLAGEVNIYIIQSEPFPPGEDLMTTIEDTARISEELLGVPFPTTDIILLVIVSKDYNKIKASGKHRGSYMRVVREVSGRVRSLPHETAHYYTTGGSRWLIEGSAEFIVEYVSQQTDHLANLGHSEKVQSVCLDISGIENIRHLIYLFSRSIPCTYYMGENFLWNIYDSIGKETVSAALSELHMYLFGRDIEEEIYQVFLKHTPDDKKEDLRDLYRRLHGGAFAFDDIDFDDDHGDEAGLATKISVGEAVVGELDYMFDFDYFKFHAEEGSRYRMIVTHDTLRSTSIGLYAPDGVTGENWIFRDSTTLGPAIVWVAPSSEDYYFAVQNFGGKTGTYTLTVTNADSTAPDDHGDAEDSATDISIGETVEGTITDDFDVDYFRFSTQENRGYYFTITRGTLKYRFMMHPNDQFYSLWLPGPGNAFWEAGRTGESFLAVRAEPGSVGPYTLTITYYEYD